MRSSRLKVVRSFSTTHRGQARLSPAVDDPLSSRLKITARECAPTLCPGRLAGMRPPRLRNAGTLGRRHQDRYIRNEMLHEDGSIPWPPPRRVSARIGSNSSAGKSRPAAMRALARSFGWPCESTRTRNGSSRRCGLIWRKESSRLIVVSSLTTSTLRRSSRRRHRSRTPPSTSRPSLQNWLLVSEER